MLTGGWNSFSLLPLSNFPGNVTAEFVLELENLVKSSN